LWHGLAIADSSQERLRWPEYLFYCLFGPGVVDHKAAAFGKGSAINGKRQAGDFLTQPEALRAEQTQDPFERALKAKEKSALANCRLTGEDVALAKASGKEAYEERTQEWWEGYDPGMDAGF
jgi:hypothetical protein